MLETLSETRTLSLHPLAIHTFIKAQAGSLGKALSEAVMNSLDAFATNVDVTLTANGFVITDDGQGFQSRAEIEAWFETLGFPHDDGNHRVFGKFGMGRAQMWAFARTTWTSNQFTMTVDVQRKGLDYDLSTGTDFYKGTRIRAEFYTPLTFQEQERVREEVFNLVKFVPGIVTFNGKVANKNPADETWDMETPQAWMKFDSTGRTLTVYNAGLLVTAFPRYRFKCAGIVVTKPEAALSLNLARNDILEATCPVWKALVKVFPQSKADYAACKQKPVRLTAREREMRAREVLAGVLTLEAALDKAPELVTSVLGRSVQYRKFAQNWAPQTVLFVDKGDELGKRILKLKLAVVLDRKVLTTFGFTTPEDFKQFLLKQFATQRVEHPAQQPAQSRYAQALADAVWSDKPAELFPELAEGRKQFSTAELDAPSRATCHAWSRATNPRFHSQVREAFGGKAHYLYVALGDTAQDVAWLDKTTNRFVLRQKEAVAAMQLPMPGLVQYVIARLWDFCQGVAETPEQATRAFLRLTAESDAVGALTLNLSRLYAREAADRDLPVPKTRLAEFDALNVE